MRGTFFSIAIAAAISTACLCGNRAHAEQPAADATTALAKLESWLGSGANGQAWSKYLNLPTLRAALAKQDKADPAAIADAVKRLGSGAAGLELSPFGNLRQALLRLQEELLIAKAPNLSEAALVSETLFQPVSAADVSKSKAALQAAAAKLDRYLQANGANGDAWKAYLRWKDLQEQLKADAPSIEALKSVEQQFMADQIGLEMPVFADVGAALTNYVHDVEASQGDLRAQYAAQLKGLSEEVRQLSENYSDESALAVGTRLGWLQNMRQGGALVHTVRGKYAHPNLHAQLSSRLATAGIKQHVDEVAPVTDNILGTYITGTGHTIGDVDARLVPSRNDAILDTILAGTTHTKTVGVNGPATIYANGTTRIFGSKRLSINENGLSGLPATANATTKTQITGIGAKRKLVQKIATKKVYQSKAEAEAIGSQHAAERVRHRVELQASSQLTKAQAEFLAKFRNPLLRRREFPELLHFSTSADRLFVEALQANRRQIGAPLAPPAVTAENDLAVQMHESLVNNFASALLSGVTLREEELQKKVIELRGSLPEQLKSEDDRDPWSITFASSRPITVKITENGFQVTVRGQRYTSGERAFRAMNVTADYKAEKSGNGAKLVRQGELQILPPGFIAGQTRLSTQQVTLKTLLQRKFGKLFEPEIVSKGLVLPGRWREAGRLDLKELQLGSGWAVLAWIESGEPAPAEEEKVALNAN